MSLSFRILGCGSSGGVPRLMAIGAIATLTTRKTAAQDAFIKNKTAGALNVLMDTTRYAQSAD